MYSLEMITALALVGKNVDKHLTHPTRDLIEEISKINTYDTIFLKEKDIIDIFFRWFELFSEKIKNDLITYFVDRYPEIFDRIPDIYKTPEICKIAVTNNGKMLQYVPDDMKTSQLIEISLKSNPWNLEFVPKNFQTEEMCIWCVLRLPASFKFVSDKLKDRKLCLIAVSQLSDNILWVPLALQTEEIFLRALMAPHNYSIRNFNMDRSTPFVCEIAFFKNFQNYHYIPRGYVTIQMCEVLVQLDGVSLEHVPDHLRNFNLCKMAFERNRLAFEYIPEAYKNYFLKLYNCNLPDKLHRSTTYIMHPDLITHEIAQREISFNPMISYPYIVRHPEKSILYIPKKLLTYSMCFMAVSLCGIALKYVPHTFKTIELCRIAVKQNGLALKYVPPDTIGYVDMCLTALSTDPLVNIKVNGYKHISIASMSRRLKRLVSKIPVVSDKILVKAYISTLDFDKLPLRYLKPVAKIVRIMLNTDFTIDDSFVEDLEKKFPEDILKQLFIFIGKSKNLRYIPDRFKTTSMCIRAVSSSGYNIVYVPHDMKTKELYDIAIKTANLEFVRIHTPREIWD